MAILLRLGMNMNSSTGGDNQWNSLGRQIATTVRLEYEDIPSGTLYLLRDLTKGKEERIFEYKERKQQFW